MYKRKYAGVDSAAGKRRRTRLSSVRKAYARPRLNRGLPYQRPHAFKQVCQQTDLVQPGGVAIRGAIEFKLNELPNVGEFTALFDKYRIKAVQLKIVPVMSAYDINPTATAPFRPNIHTVIDYNDANIPGALTDLFQYDTYRMTTGDKVHARYLCPRVSQEVYRSAVSTSYAMMKKGTWLDCTTGGTDVPHFAVKYAIDSVPGLPIDYNLSYKVYKTIFFDTWSSK